MKIIRTFLGKVLLCSVALHLAIAAGGTVLLAGCTKGNDGSGNTKPVDKPSVEEGQGGYLFAHMTNANYGSLFYSISRDGLSWKTLNGGKVILESYFGHPDICEEPDVFGKADRRWYMIGVVRGSSKESLVLWHTTDLVVWKNKVAILALAVWLVVYGLFLTWRLLRTYHRVIRIFDETHADDIGAYIKWLSVFTYWAIIFGVGCGLLTFLPDRYVYIWILMSIPFYIYLFLCYLNYMLFYEQVESAMEVNEGLEHFEAEPTQETPSYHAEIAERIKGWINADGYVRTGLTIKDLSEQLHTNRTYLSEFINTTYGVSFRDWITGLRIDYAKRLLVQYPKLTLADISERSGFLSPSHFIRIFKENAGCTPTRWRKK